MVSFIVSIVGLTIPLISLAFFDLILCFFATSRQSRPISSSARIASSSFPHSMRPLILVLQQATSGCRPEDRNLVQIASRDVAFLALLQPSSIACQVDRVGG